MPAPIARRPPVISLGCRLNLAEGERIGALVAGAPDLVVVDSCAVTSAAAPGSIVADTPRAVERGLLR